MTVTIYICAKAPIDGGTALAAGQRCPFCGKPIAEHEEAIRRPLRLGV